MNGGQSNEWTTKAEGDFNIDRTDSPNPSPSKVCNKNAVL